MCNESTLFRPGRVDRKEFIDYADGEMLGKVRYLEITVAIVDF